MKIALYADVMYPVFGICERGEKKYFLSDEEYADYLDVEAKWEAWQKKLRALKPDGYVAPAPPTEEELELRRFLASSASELALQTPDSEAA